MVGYNGALGLDPVTFGGPGSSRNRLVRDEFSGGVGIGSTSVDNVVRDSSFPTSVFGAVDVFGSRNRIVGNQVGEAFLGPGIAIDDGDRNVVERNRVTVGKRVPDDGIFVAAPATRTLVSPTSRPATATTGSTSTAPGRP